MSAIPMTSRRLPGSAICGWGIGTTVVLAQGLVFRWSPVDDAYISFRDARNWATGQGIVFNPGDRVEGYSNFLWTAMLALTARFTTDLATVSMILGAILASATLLATAALAARCAAERGTSNTVALLAPLFLACYPGWAYWAFSGMEGMLCCATGMALMLVGCAGSFSRRAALTTGALAAAVALTRPESVLLWPIVAVARATDRSASPHRRRAWLVHCGLTAVAVFGSYLVWRISYYGDMFPNTYYAKVGGRAFDRLPRGVLYLGELGVSWLLPISGALWLIGGLRRWSVIVIATMVVYGLFGLWAGGDHFPWLRFFIPILPLAAILLASTVTWVEQRATIPRNQWAFRAIAVCIAATYLVGVGMKLDWFTAREHQLHVERWRVVGRWAATELPADATLAVTPIGAIGYESDRSILDMLGLADRMIAREGRIDYAEGPGHQRDSAESVLARRPEFILGEGRVFDRSPSEEEIRRSTRRHTLRRLLDLPDFRDSYVFELAPAGNWWIAYWRRVDVPPPSSAISPSADAS